MPAGAEAGPEARAPPAISRAVSHRRPLPSSHRHRRDPQTPRLLRRTIVSRGGPSGHNGFPASGCQAPSAPPPPTEVMRPAGAAGDLPAVTASVCGAALPSCRWLGQALPRGRLPHPITPVPREAGASANTPAPPRAGGRGRAQLRPGRTKPAARRCARDPGRRGRGLVSGWHPPSSGRCLGLGARQAGPHLLPPRGPQRCWGRRDVARGRRSRGRGPGPAMAAAVRAGTRRRLPAGAERPLDMGTGT